MNTQLELWGGPECTVNRVGETYFDQLERTGHARRPADLDLFADLGVRALRYPVLWERTAPNGIDHADWAWSDERLGHLRELDIMPIAGLVHHGSGPRLTSLLDPQFPEKLAEYAGAVARRYPWLTHYTPVNEPLTTARFSGLYGHWYPHACDGLSWARMLLNQCRAVALSMAAIREVNPNAQLVQTEDMGKTHSTPAMAYQADFENERRWLTFDLLCGRVDRHHPMGQFLCWLGIGENELRVFQDNPCPPDIFGINYYVTSERFLDERTQLYPPHTVGTNPHGAYADVEAVRVCEDGVCGPAKLLREVWQRYGGPLAVTEAHLGASADEQMRWFGEVWDAAQMLRREGVDVRAVTAWALLGGYDWDSLVTRDAGHYEPGAFDLRGGKPRPTALAAMLRDLGRRGRHAHPHLETPGWWRRSERLLYPPVPSRESRSENARGQLAV